MRKKIIRSITKKEVKGLRSIVRPALLRTFFVINFKFERLPNLLKRLKIGADLFELGNRFVRSAIVRFQFYH